ncbi:hypothetical protein B0T16DRAFT_394511 [Cercophora newfieldiana]|uniref:Uncharacterized protein n=1 Tax=Cercophora newfieldiana TaxID=92897 RepID=A0AA39XR07_9PEZI|nr:hypothetical protein B0T16DRAFT_394511 [Cercophora newfieldiana]
MGGGGWMTWGFGAVVSLVSWDFAVVVGCLGLVSRDSLSTRRREGGGGLLWVIWLVYNGEDGDAYIWNNVDDHDGRRSLYSLEIAWLWFSSDDLPDLLRGEPIPWRANISDCCWSDQINQTIIPATATVDNATPHDTTMSLCSGGGYHRKIYLGLNRGRGERRSWDLGLTIESWDGDWLASLSRDDAAALVSLDSVTR